MESQEIEIIADLNCREIVPLNELDPKKVVKDLIGSGHEMIILRGCLLDKFDNEIWIYSDDDIESLIISYIYLETIVGANNYEHGEFLNDGLLSFTAKCTNRIVNMELRYCPEINIVNLVVKQISLTSDEYLWWWRSIANAIYIIAKSI